MSDVLRSTATALSRRRLATELLEVVIEDEGGEKGAEEDR